MNRTDLPPIDRRLLRQALALLLMLLPSAALACLQPSPSEPILWTALVVVNLGMLLALASP